MAITSSTQAAEAEDKNARLEYIKIIKKAQTSSPFEKSVFEQVKNEISNSSQVYEVLDPDLFIPKWKVLSEKVGIGKCHGVVETSPEELLAWLWHNESNQSKASHVKQNGSDSSKFPNKVVCRINDHSNINYSCRKLGAPLAARDWLTRGIWRKICHGVVETSPEELLAWLWHNESNQSKASHVKQNGSDSSKFPNKVVCRINDHSNINYSCRKLGAPLAARDWLTRGIWRKIDSDSYMLIFKSIADDDPDVPQSFQKTSLENVVRGELTAIYKFRRLPYDQTNFTMTAKADVKGSLPTKLANRAISKVLNTVLRACEYFNKPGRIDQVRKGPQFLNFPPNSKHLLTSLGVFFTRRRS